MTDESNTKIKSRAWVDGVTIAALTLLLVCKAVPDGYETAAFAALCLIGGGNQILAALHNRGSFTLLLLGALPYVLRKAGFALWPLIKLSHS